MPTPETTPHPDNEPHRSDTADTARAAVRHTKQRGWHDAEGAILRGVQVSGQQYVSIQAGDSFRAQKVLFRPTHKCNHVATICRECAEQWGWDHRIHFERTAAGRQLRADIQTHATRDTGHDAEPPSELLAADAPSAPDTPHMPDPPVPPAPDKG